MTEQALVAVILLMNLVQMAAQEAFAIHPAVQQVGNARILRIETINGTIVLGMVAVLMNIVQKVVLEAFAVHQVAPAQKEVMHPIVALAAMKEHIITITVTAQHTQ